MPDGKQRGQSTDDVAESNARHRNIEIKARIASLENSRAVALKIATSRLGQEHQVDTYFVCRAGRLKLREIDGRAAQLVWYERADVTSPKQSDYYLIEINDPENLKRALAIALGIAKVVDKQREIFLYQNVRIHLDEVQEIGTFLELEAVLSADENEPSARAKIDDLLRQFAISPEQLLANSYADMN